MPTMQERWSQLATRLELPSPLAKDLWKELKELHSGPGRHYHNLNHLEFMLERIPGKLAAPELELAIWFHDAIYDPTRSNNEEASALLFQARLGDQLPPEQVAAVVRLISITAHGRLRPSSELEFLLLDLDLLILSEPAPVYDQYAASIRAEYEHVPEDAYRKGRRQILERFQSMSVYWSEFFRTREETAQANLARELAVLNSPTAG